MKVLGVCSSPSKLNCDYSVDYLKAETSPLLFYLKARELQRTEGVVQWGFRGRPLAEKIDSLALILARGLNAMSMIDCGSVLGSSVTFSS